MREKWRTFGVSKALLVILVVSLTLGQVVAVKSISTVHTIGPWTLSKPWNPLKIANNTIPIGETMDVSAVLEAGKKYHIFLVGDWVNPDNPKTDYDVIIRSPYDSLSFTEATGLPEQASNDPPGQFYISQQSGTYHFLIHNDPEDSRGAQSAVFMIIEHVDTDKSTPPSYRGDCCRRITRSPSSPLGTSSRPRPVTSQFTSTHPTR
jgi:hypothetical protein